MSIQHDRMNVEQIDNQDERKDIWRRVYAHVFSAAFMQRYADPSRFLGTPLDEFAQEAADLAIANIPTSREIIR